MIFKQFISTHAFPHIFMVVGGERKLGKSRFDKWYCHHWQGDFSKHYKSFQLEVTL